MAALITLTKRIRFGDSFTLHFAVGFFLSSHCKHLRTKILRIFAGALSVCKCQVFGLVLFRGHESLLSWSSVRVVQILSSCDIWEEPGVNQARWKSLFSVTGSYDKGNFPCSYILLYLMFLEALIISLMRGTPKVMFIEATPAKWKVFNVIWVPGSPMLCAQRAPTAEPGSIWALGTRHRHMMRQEAGATSFKVSFHSVDWNVLKTGALKGF